MLNDLSRCPQYNLCGQGEARDTLGIIRSACAYRATGRVLGKRPLKAVGVVSRPPLPLPKRITRWNLGVLVDTVASHSTHTSAFGSHQQGPDWWTANLNPATVETALLWSTSTPYDAPCRTAEKKPGRFR